MMLNKKIYILVLQALFIFSNPILAMKSSIEEELLPSEEPISSRHQPVDIEEEEEGPGAAGGRSSEKDLKALKEKISRINDSMYCYLDGSGNGGPQATPLDPEMLLENPDLLKDLERVLFSGRQPRFSCCGYWAIRGTQVLAAIIGGAAVTFVKTVIMNGLIDLISGERSTERAALVGLVSFCLDGPVAAGEAVKLVRKALTKRVVVLQPCPKGEEEGARPKAWRYSFSRADKILQIGGGMASFALAAMPFSLFSTLEARNLEYLLPLGIITIVYYALPYGKAIQRSLESRTIWRNSDTNSRQIREILSASLEELERLLKREADDPSSRGPIVGGLWEFVSEGIKAIRSGNPPRLSPLLALFTRSAVAHELPRIREVEPQREEAPPEELVTMRGSLSAGEQKILEEWGKEVDAKDKEKFNLLKIWDEFSSYREAEKKDRENLLILWKIWQEPQGEESQEREPLLAGEEDEGEALRAALFAIRGVSLQHMTPSQRRFAIRETIPLLQQKLKGQGRRGQLEQRELSNVRGPVPGDALEGQDHELKQAIRAAMDYLSEEGRKEFLERENLAQQRQAHGILKEEVRKYKEEERDYKELKQAFFEIRQMHLVPVNAEQERGQLGRALLELRGRLTEYVAAWNERLSTYGARRNAPLTYEHLFICCVVAMSTLSQIVVEKSAIAEMEESVFTISGPPARVFGYIIAFVSAFMSILAEPQFHLKTIKALQSPLNPEPYDNRGARLAGRTLGFFYAVYNSLLFCGVHYLVFKDSPTLIPGLIVLAVRMMSVFNSLSEEGVYSDVITYMKTGSTNPTRNQKLTGLNHWIGKAKKFMQEPSNDTLGALHRMIFNPISGEVRNPKQGG